MPVFVCPRLITMPGGVKRSKGAKRTRPNILVTGTPGTGKTTLAKAIVDTIPGLARYSVGEEAKEKGFLGEWDEGRECHVLEEEPGSNLQSKKIHKLEKLRLKNLSRKSPENC